MKREKGFTLVEIQAAMVLFIAFSATAMYLVKDISHHSQITRDSLLTVERGSRALESMAQTIRSARSLLEKDHHAQRNRERLILKTSRGTVHFYLEKGILKQSLWKEGKEEVKVLASRVGKVDFEVAKKKGRVLVTLTLHLQPFDKGKERIFRTSALIRNGRNKK